MIVEDIKFQSLKDYLANTNPSLEKQEAVYRLTFENGKCYVGQSIDVLQRIEYYFMEIQSEGRFTGLSWHRDAVRDNGLSFMPFYEMIKHIKIEIFLCKNSVEVEALILLNGDWERNMNQRGGIIVSYFNQKTIRIIKALSNKENFYGIFNKKCMYNAMKELTPTAFKIWCYLNCNQNEYELELAPSDVRPKCDIGEKTYYRGVNELIEKGFLIEVELRENKTGYLFLEGSNKMLSQGGEETRPEIKLKMIRGSGQE